MPISSYTTEPLAFESIDVIPNSIGKNDLEEDHPGD
jgi:hypothetical protein